MRDGRTRKQASAAPMWESQILQKMRAALVVLSGPAKGREIELAKIRTIVGRGPGVDVVIEDEAMSRQHAAFELGAVAVRVLDLGSTNGVHVNGNRVEVQELQHGDRVKIGDHELQFLLEEVQREPRTYDISD